VVAWCTAYSEITTSLQNATPDKNGAATSLNALQSFDKLWASGANLGYITTEESDANRRAIVAYSQVMKLIVDGKATDSQEVKDASKALTDVTTKDQALLNSSSAKTSALCGPVLPKASPTAPASGAASGGASTPASAAASPSKS